MTDRDPTEWSRRPGAWAALVVGSASIFIQVAAAVTSLFAMLYGLWLMMRRPVNMPVKIGVTLAATAGAFVLDTAATGESPRLIGTLVAGGLAWWVASSRPTADHNRQ